MEGGDTSDQSRVPPSARMGYRSTKAITKSMLATPSSANRNPAHVPATHPINRLRYLRRHLEGEKHSPAKATTGGPTALRGVRCQPKLPLSPTPNSPYTLLLDERNSRTSAVGKRLLLIYVSTCDQLMRAVWRLGVAFVPRCATLR